MDTTKQNNRDGARPVESRQASRVPGPKPRKGPPLATGGHLASTWVAGRRRSRGNATGQPNIIEMERKFNILQWNAEGIMRKKGPLAERLHQEKVDVACIQETHMNPNHRLSVRGYETYKMPREGHKGGILILVKNNLAATPFELDTAQEAEIQGVKVSLDNTTLSIFNYYCPQDKDLSLQTMDIPTEKCLVVGDFNSHSTCWGYEGTDRRGDEVEDWQIENNLLLLNDAEDPPTYFSRRWLTTSTPDLAFASEDISRNTERKVLNQLGGSDHKPVLLTISLHSRPAKAKTFPRWNYKKANWDKFTSLADEYCKSTKVDDYNINRAREKYTQAVLQAATESIPRGARKNYKPYWTEELQDLEDQVSKARTNVENNPTVENNITFKACTARYKKTYIQAARESWREKTEKLNMDKDGRKLWKLTKALNDEDSRTGHVVVEKGQDSLSGRKAANCLMDNFEQVSNLTVPEEKKRAIREDLHKEQNEEVNPEHMNKPFTLKELDAELNTLKEKKSPGPDRITNEMLTHLGPKAKKKLLELYNNSWTTGHIPQLWKDADMIPIHKKGKDKKKAESYRPISLTSCMGKLLERMINTRLSWHLEKENFFAAEQAGFRHHRSTEDQVTYIAQKIEDGFQDKQHTLTVWIDLEKAYDRVWKDGLRLKLKRCGVHGHMYRWISQYLINRKARVHINGEFSRKKTLREGVPQGGVLSPTLFLIFINDIIKDLPSRVQGAIYADDLVIWCSEEQLTTARSRIQRALETLEKWLETWLVKINTNKTTYTVFSLSPKEQRISLTINKQTLRPEENPTYLGITFDKRLTWKQQTEKAEARGKVRLAIMKKLAGTTWGADATTLKRLYTGRVRPVLEYGITAWGNASKANFNKVSKVQNQATRIITGAMRTTQIIELENATGLHSIEDRKETKVLVQAGKYRRLQDHPMKRRMNQPTKGRLKRGSFIHESKDLERQNNYIGEQTLTDIPKCHEFPTWKEDKCPTIQHTIPGIRTKDSQGEQERKSLTLEYLQNIYPKEEWARVYTDGSAENAVRNGGAGVYIQYPDGNEEKIHHATGLHSTNYRAEVEALKTGVDAIKSHSDGPDKVVFLTDSLSALQGMQTGKDHDLRNLAHSINELCLDRTVHMQWIPSHCGINGNEVADRLAKEGSEQEQTDRSTNFREYKSIVKAKQNDKWLQNHPRHNRNDPYHKLTRREQVTIFRLRTGHNRLNHHMYNKLRIGTTEQCPCGSGKQTTEHILQKCHLYNAPRGLFWPNQTILEKKLYGSLEDLQKTVAFIDETGVSI